MDTVKVDFSQWPPEVAQRLFRMLWLAFIQSQDVAAPGSLEKLVLEASVLTALESISDPGATAPQFGSIPIRDLKSSTGAPDGYIFTAEQAKLLANCVLSSGIHPTAKRDALTLVRALVP